MKKISFVFLVILTISATPWSMAAAESIVIIVNSSNGVPSLTVANINNIYRGKQVNWANGKKLQVVNHPVDSDTRLSFYRSVLNEQPGKKFTIAGSPKPFRSSIRKSDKSVLRFVSRFEGAIGYVTQSAVNDSVKVVYTFQY